MTKALKTLVVEDSDLQADILESMLHNLDIMDVTKIDNGIHALQYFKEALGTAAPYSLVFLDIVMPGMDGQEALKQMRAMERDAGGKTTIIMTTALDSPQDMIEALIEGDCSDYIVKPVEANSLKAMLHKHGLL